MMSGAGNLARSRLSSRPCGRLGEAAWKGGCGRDCPPHGQALVEFAMAALVTLLLVLAVVEFSRIMLVSTTLADAARLGARYAITHGTIPGNGVPTTSTIQSGVQAVVKKFLAPGTVNINAAVISTSFPGNSTIACVPGATTPGCPVVVNVSYRYNLLLSHLPVNVTLSTTSEGVITW
jgi:Flp pilus assembly protein TadG